VTAKQTETVTSSIGLLREQREQAQYAAALLKSMRQRSELSEGEYRQGVLCYVGAKAAVDGWLDRLLSELETGGGRELSDSHMQTLQDAGVKVHAFMDYVSGLGEDRSQGALDALAKVLPDTIKALVDAGIKLWGEIRPTGKDRREALIRRIEALRWLSFENVPAAT
jgi:hypothetical protein